MIQLSPPGVRDFEKVAEEVEDLLERLRTTALEAVACVERDDLAGLASSIRARDEVFELLPRLMTALNAARAAALTAVTAPDLVRIDGVIARITETLHGVRDSDARLLDVLHRIHGRAADELDRLASSDPASATYRAPAASVGRHLDFTR